METSADGVRACEELVRVVEPQICAVTPELVDWFWVRGVSEWIGDALHRSVMHELGVDEVYADCKSGRYLLLAIKSQDKLTGCAVVAASDDPSGRPYLGLICCGGERVHEWLSVLVSTCKLIARQIGAREIVVMGRHGWRPLLAAHGLRLRSVVMVLDLED